MIESNLTELLERTGDRTNVGPPPIEAMRVGAARRRRRRTMALSLASAAAVVAAAVGTALIATPGMSRDDAPAATPAPAQLRLVGIGHAAIAVPVQWGTNESRCGTPQQDTDLIDDPSAALLCLAPRPIGVESVELASGKPARFDFHADETIEVGGVRAERQRTSCSVGTIGPRICLGTVFIPSLDVSFRAESSTNADEVDRILERIVIVPDRVGVPGFGLPRNGQRITGENYPDMLTEAGLVPKIQTKRSHAYVPGEILAVSPAPGTMLKPGATVTVTVTER